jgi:predicted permease
MRRARGFFVALCLVASLGVGATTAMASLVEAALLRGPPFPDADRLVMLWSTRPDDDRVQPSLPDVADWRRQAQSFEQLGVVHDWGFGFSVPGSGVSDMTLGALVSGDFFSLLGARPLHGRLLNAQDDGEDQPCRTVLTELTFRHTFRADPSTVGRQIELDGISCTVVGIAEPGFDFMYPQSERVLLWATRAAIWPGSERTGRDAQEFHVLGKLRAGVSVESSSTELAGIAERISREHPGHQLGARVTSLHEDLVYALRPKVAGLFAAIAMMFLAACSNIAGLFLVRAQARRGELSLRQALGATRSRLVRQLVTELAVVYGVAAPTAWLIAGWFVSLFQSITLSSSDPRVEVNGSVLLACLAISIGTGLLFALGPGLALSRTSISSAVVEAGTGAPASQRRLRGALVVLQIAAACALAASSRTALHAVSELLKTQGGFPDQDLVAMRISPQRSLFPEATLVELFERITGQLAAQPGVVAATACSGLPLKSQYFDGNFERVRPQSGAAQLRARFVGNVILPGYLSVAGIPLLAGREFVAADSRNGAPRVALIGETLRARHFPNEDPIGQWLRHDLLDNQEAVQIVGVVGDVRRFGLQIEPTDEIYVPFGQTFIRTMELVLRTEPGQARAVANQLQGWLREIEPRIALWGARVQNGGFASTVRPERKLSLLLTAFATVCLTLAALGLYAAVSYATAQRTREYGIRSALGASPAQIVWLVVAAALRWLAYGLLLALVAVRALGELMSRTIAGAPSFDARSFLEAAGVVACVALAACLVPALRALRLQPALALRRE